jgi:GNAT superfamily N-acetyltransferase
MVRTVEFRDIAVDSETDLVLLRSFYDVVYRAVFPDENERESLESLISYLQADAEQNETSRGCRYRMVVMLADGEPIGGSIFDYLIESNFGVIEFLFIKPQSQGRGFGRRMLDKTEELLRKDAAHYSGHDLGWIIAEMDDPFVHRRTPDNFDSFTRALIWHRWGYRAIDFPYVQPALSETKRPVRHLLLMAKPVTPPTGHLSALENDTIPGGALITAIRGYLRWAMRIIDADENPEFRRMAEHLAARPEAGLIRLDKYVGMAAEDALEITEAANREDPAFGDAVGVYKNVFTDPAEAVPITSFHQLLSPRGDRLHGCRYHLWAVSGGPGQACEGMASFFTLPSSGFGGYVALTGSLRGRGLLSPLLRRIEQRMVRDDSRNRGWYIECGEKTDRTRFTRHGFRELAVEYRQPRLPGTTFTASADRPLHLLYKAFARVYEHSELTVDEFLPALRDILRCVYEIEEPGGHPSYQAIAAELMSSPIVPFR